MSDGSFPVTKTEGGGLIWFILACFIPWQKTSLSRLCCQLTSLLQDDLGRELLSHHLPYSLLSFSSVVLVTEGDVTFFSFCLELSRFLCWNTALEFSCFGVTLNWYLNNLKPEGMLLVPYAFLFPTFAPQPCKDNANTAQQNMEQLIALYTVTLPITSFDSQLGWVLTWGATTFHWDLLLQVE